jgi:integrase
LCFAEINFAAAQIELPGSRTKTGEAHIIPLCSFALSILKARARRPGSDFVFGSDRGFSAWSKFKRRLEAKAGIEQQWQLHDFRRSLSTIMNGKLNVPWDVVEACLGHTIPGVRGIYNRSTYLDQRREALARYADHIRRAHLSVVPQQGANDAS